MDPLTTWWARWWADPQAIGALLPVVYDPWLVVLSVLVACAGGIAAMQMVTIARRRERFGGTVAWLAYGLAALAMGASVWGMHFIGMLAVDICQPVRYDPWVTAVSAVPALVASWMGLRLYATPAAPASANAAAGGGIAPTIDVRRVIVGGVWVGAGIGAMHYTGMAAMRMDAALRYDPLGFALSLVVAVALAILGLGTREWLRHHTRVRGLAAVTVAGTVLGLATAGMHYTAMQASLFVGTPDPTYAPWSSRPVELALTIAAELFLAFGFAWGTLGILTYRAMAARLRERESLLRTILDDMPVAAVRLRVSAQGTYSPVFASRALGDLVGLPVDAYLRQAWTLQQRVHPEDLPVASERLLATLRTGQPQRITARLRHEREGWRHALLLARASPARDHMALDIYALDVSGEHRINAERHALLAGIDRVACRAVLSPDGRFLEVNEPLARTLGYTPAELVGRPHADVWPDEPDARATMERFWATLRAGQAVEGEFVRRACAGRATDAP